MARETMDDLRSQLLLMRSELEEIRAETYRLRAVLAVIQAALGQALDSEGGREP